MKALVLGATGHIGAHITRALLGEGHQVRAAYRNAAYRGVLDGLFVEQVFVDLDKPETLKSALDGIDWVFYAAGYYPGRTEKKEAAIARGIAAARSTLEIVARANPNRIVFTSSAATLKHVGGRPSNENDPEDWPLTEWRHPYSAVKIAMEQEALRAAREGLPVVITNPTVCVGEYDSRGFSGRAVLLYARKQVPIYTQTMMNAVYTGDVGIGHLRAAERGRIGERYLLAGQNITLKQFADLTAKEAGVAPPRLPFPYPVAFSAGLAVEIFSKLTGRQPLFTRQEVKRLQQGHRFDGSKAVRELEMPQTPLEEAIRRSVNWFRNNGMIRR
jgi:dihydroflavonol-4-reductase